MRELRNEVRQTCIVRMFSTRIHPLKMPRPPQKNGEVLEKQIGFVRRRIEDTRRGCGDEIRAIRLFVLLAGWYSVCPTTRSTFLE